MDIHITFTLTVVGFIISTTILLALAKRRIDDLKHKNKVLNQELDKWMSFWLKNKFKE